MDSSSGVEQLVAQPGTGPTILDVIRRQLEPTLEMLQEVIDECPEELWDAGHGNVPLWQQAYHSIYWLHAWARDWTRPFEPPVFHTREALDMAAGATPVFTRQQLADYLGRVRAECDAFLRGFTPESLVEEQEAFGVKWTPADRLLGQIRHVQHHVGSMHTVLYGQTGRVPRWIGYGEE